VKGAGASAAVAGGHKPAACRSARRFRPRGETRITPRVKTPKKVSWAPAAQIETPVPLRGAAAAMGPGFTRGPGKIARIRTTIGSAIRSLLSGNRVNLARPIRATGHRAVWPRTRDRVIAPSGPRISVVAITAFDYGANLDPAVRRVTMISMLMNSPHGNVTKHSTERHDRREPWPPTSRRSVATRARRAMDYATARTRARNCEGVA
jgi:hypothetical protein